MKDLKHMHMRYNSWRSRDHLNQSNGQTSFIRHVEIMPMISAQKVWQVLVDLMDRSQQNVLLVMVILTLPGLIAAYLELLPPWKPWSVSLFAMGSLSVVSDKLYSTQNSLSVAYAVDHMQLMKMWFRFFMSIDYWNTVKCRPSICKVNRGWIPRCFRN